VVHGDVTRPGLGLDAATRDWLEQHVTLVIHCAALVRFDAAWDDLAAVNIGGTRHVAQ
jgi:thioester reductase-like protein